LLAVFEFEIGWGKAAEGGVDALAIIERLDVVEDGGAGLAVGGEVAAVDELEFEGAPEALHGGVVVAVSAATHGGDEAGASEGRAKLPAAYWTPRSEWKRRSAGDRDGAGPWRGR
jgi:hypothetical protein